MTQNYKLFFAKNREAAASHLVERSVFIWPAMDRWNDHGFRLLTDYVVCGPNGTARHEPSLFAALACSSHADTKEFIDSYVGTAPVAEFPSDGGDSSHHGPSTWFATLQGDLSQYRLLVDSLGLDEARAVLNAMHDIPDAELREPRALWLASAIEGDAFSTAVLRSSTRYFAYRRARHVLQGNEQASMEKAEASARLTFQLDSFSTPHIVDLDFGRSRFFDRRINVLIGENGVGKSQTLSQLIKALAHGRPKATLTPKGEFSRVIAFSGIASQTSLPTGLSHTRRLQYRFFPLSPRSNSNTRRVSQTAALLDLIRDTEMIGGMPRIDIFQQALNDWLDLKRIALPLKQSAARSRDEIEVGKGTRFLPITTLVGDDRFFLKRHASIDVTRPPIFLDARSGISIPLSSGQEMFFRFALNLCAFIEVGTLVLVDEPENHLHPNFITRFMSLLREILKLTGSFALVASHSPFVVREVTRRDVSIMSRTKGGESIIRRPRLQTLGASVAAVSAYVFGDETVPTLARLTIDALSGRGAPDNISWLEDLREDYSNEAISHVRASLQVTAEQEGDA
ncbi:putative AbiEii toxin of type IV toxin-antitoxin system [Luteibacter sp. OK325]|uniref:AAA family ATPase n=1 Tax=Luteibacter sp. OK325 TaxID=2135670 RepID=UPI000D45273D|nr:AAA family ATPase [Luteibacter sp. OK325]PTR35368.1 putative AbiEii toxin of type IV toxin-antitoxin system [Luteibacter sp. OK325]